MGVHPKRHWRITQVRHYSLLWVHNPTSSSASTKASSSIVVNLAKQKWQGLANTAVIARGYLCLCERPRQRLLEGPQSRFQRISDLPTTGRPPFCLWIIAS